MQLHVRELNKELKNNAELCKNTKATDNTIISKSFLALFTKLINKFERSTSYQTGIFIKSMSDWLDRKNNNEPRDSKITDINPGDIYMIDWNISYSPELSYEHPCLVLKNMEDFLLVLPVCGQKSYIEIAYHPTKNPDGNKNYRLVDTSDGFKKECVIHINQLKTISKERILSKIGVISSSNDEYNLFDEIISSVIDKYFYEEYISVIEENSILKKSVDYLSVQRKKNQSRADKYRNYIKRLNKKHPELNIPLDKLGIKS